MKPTEVFNLKVDKVLAYRPERKKRSTISRSKTSPPPEGGGGHGTFSVGLMSASVQNPT